MIKVKANQPFAHGSLNVSRGDEINVSASMAADLEKAGLVTIQAAKKAAELENKAMPEPENKMAPDASNKAAAVKPHKAKKV